MKIIVILPTYNEKTNIERMLPLLEKEVFPGIKHHEMAILVADDKSPDGTADVVRQFMKSAKNIHLLIGNKEGLGKAYARAMNYAMNELKADAIVELDSDFQHNPHDIPRLIAAMDKGADCVIGSRYVPGGSIPKEWGIHRKFLSFFAGSLFTRLVWWNFSIHDMTSGFKLTRTAYLKKVDLDNLYSKYYAYKLHILHDVIKKGAKVVEVPIVFSERKEGSSKITGKDLFDSLYVVLRLQMEDKKRFLKFLIVGGTGFLLQLLTVFLAVHLGIEQFIAAMLGGEVAILSNFVINNLWTFGDTKDIKEQSHFWARLIKFNVASLGSIVIQGAVVYLAVHALGTHFLLVGVYVPTAIVTLIPTILLIVIPLNYIVYNKVIWKTQYLKTTTHHT